jgi:hypothetical protein
MATAAQEFLAADDNFAGSAHVKYRLQSAQL